MTVRVIVRRHFANHLQYNHICFANFMISKAFFVSRPMKFMWCGAVWKTNKIDCTQKSPWSDFPYFSFSSTAATSALLSRAQSQCKQETEKKTWENIQNINHKSNTVHVVAIEQLSIDFEASLKITQSWVVIWNTRDIGVRFHSSHTEKPLLQNFIQYDSLFAKCSTIWNLFGFCFAPRSRLN